MWRLENIYEIIKRGGGIFFLWRVEFFKIGKRGPHVYYRDESRVEPEFEPFCLLML